MTDAQTWTPVAATLTAPLGSTGLPAVLKIALSTPARLHTRSTEIDKVSFGGVRLVQRWACGRKFLPPNGRRRQVFGGTKRRRWHKGSSSVLQLRGLVSCPVVLAVLLVSRRVVSPARHSRRPCLSIPDTRDMSDFAALAQLGPPLTAREALSGVFGSISLASWIFLLVPQLIENYKQGSAEGISLAFLVVWFIGDITNLAGALWAGLVPTVTALAVYFCFADLILIAQCVYYNLLNARKARRKSVRSTNTQDSAEQPLLGRRDSSIGLPGSHRRRSSAASRRRRESVRAESLGGILEEDEAGHKTWIKNALSLIGVCIVGTAGWAIAWRTGVWVPTPTNEDSAGEIAFGAQILGYASAVCYLGARIPQIIKNQRDRSCEGLSLLFFMLSLLGNATYGAGILFHSVEKEYFLTNLPWLIGSLGTMVEDAAIFIQFRVFGEGTQSAALV
ncbi:PQ-loop-domain-containing protein [Amniculicola lignicola CBS 123094]|uniref:PQ-loop-domain-containing protein n=1 Tax=Amniculicola lignicola CBS 123094 TaxID=1392246 RepID=A0A6A5WTF6_9PLEO|nr:PQ-loop-domain-containing protein [Amniculicola lignicola CBS 123094]